MKKVLISLLALSAFIFSNADNKVFAIEKLPQKAKTFVEQYFPTEKISFATVDDDFIRPDYQVMLSDRTQIEFTHSGDLKNIESFQKAIPEGIIPAAIISYVTGNFPDAFCLEFEVDKNSYDVKLSNRLELKFSKNFQLMEIDD